MPEESESPQVLHNLSGNKKTTSVFIMIVFLLLLAGAGVGIGYVLSRSVHSTNTLSQNTAGGSAAIVPGVVLGSTDTTTFKDTATGNLQKGGIDGEGQFHLVRLGGPSQYVYLTSSVIDLSQFINHDVQVWGQTNAAKTAGWLMDVGRLEVKK